MLTHEQHIEAAAYHEAGHAVIAWRHGVVVRGDGVSIDPETYLGYCRFRSMVYPGEAVVCKRDGGRHWRSYLWRVNGEVAIDQAGQLAEQAHHGLGTPHSEIEVLDELATWASYGFAFGELLKDEGHMADLPSAVFWLAEAQRAQVGTDRLTDSDERLIARQYLSIQRRLCRILRRPRTWRAIEAMADRLVESHHIDGDEAFNIVEGCRVPTEPYPA